MSASLADGNLETELGRLTDAEIAFLAHDWMVWARDDQLPPASTVSGPPWRTWLILGGRGAGKTRTGAEWVRAQALGIRPFALSPASRIALVGETLSDVRRVMVEGVSGLLAVHAPHERPDYSVTRGELVWPTGAMAQMFSADEAESLRGPQFAVAWVDELAKWRRPERAWDNLQFGLRLGTDPRVVVTTTPRPIPLLKQIMEDAATVITRAATRANAHNLAPAFIAEVERRYAGTPLGRQELEGEIVEERAGALWKRSWIHAHRLRGRPEELETIVVAVDPPVTATASSDACGIVVAARGRDGRGYILADRSVEGRDPSTWARAAVAACRDFLADRIVAEVNQGGDLVITVLRQIDPTANVRAVRATRGKWIRAEPVAALYAEGRVAHCGMFAKLEDQMCAFGADGLANGRSPDRLDALVWALTDLMLSDRPPPMVRSL